MAKGKGRLIIMLTLEAINSVVKLPVDIIRSNSMQPRKIFDEQDIYELAKSIKENGLLQPITVRPIQCGEFELIAGERRLIAIKVLGEKEIPAIIEAISDEKSSILALIENLQRKDLCYFEEAEAYSLLMEKWDISQMELAKRLGKAQSTIANKIRLLKLTDKEKTEILKQNLTERHARALLKIDAIEDREIAIEHIAKAQLNVEQTERYIDRTLENGSNKEKPKRLLIVKDFRIFINTINKAIDTMKEAGILANADKEENEDYINYTIKIPKSSIYSKKSQEQQAQQLAQ